MYRAANTECATKQRDDRYRSRYLATWALPLLLFVAAIVLLPWSIVAFVENSRTGRERGTWMAITAVVCFALVLWMRRPQRQLRFRAGAGLFSGLFGASADVAPQPANAVAVARMARSAQGKLPRIVGGAWSNVLRMQTSTGPRFHTRRMVGRVPNMPFTWYAGTTIKEINRELAVLGLQLLNVPSYSSVTVGAWVATQGHGMTGRAFAHDPITVSARVLDLKTGIETDDGPEMLLDRFGTGPERAAQFLIVSVSLEGSATLVKNRNVLRQVRWITTPQDATWVTRKEAWAAALFIGGSRTLGITWHPVNPRSEVTGGGLLADASILMFAVLGMGLGDPSGSHRDRTELLDRVPGFFHFYLSPIYIWFFLLLGVKNIEFFTTQLDLTPGLLLKLSDEIQAVYKQHYGRCELRFSGKLTYFDLFVVSDAAAVKVLRVLAANGVTRVAQHPGKYQLAASAYASVGLQLACAKTV
jgi:hypothetical protein